MGCVVNGPGEAADADFAICAAKDKAYFYRNGEKDRHGARVRDHSETAGSTGRTVARSGSEGGSAGMTSQTREMLKRLGIAVVFGMAFAYIESAVVVYLRVIFHPNGFTFPLEVFGVTAEAQAAAADRDRAGSRHARADPDGRMALRAAPAGASRVLPRHLRRLGCLLLRLAQGPAGLARLDHGLGRAVPDPRGLGVARPVPGARVGADVRVRRSDPAPLRQRAAPDRHATPTGSAGWPP